MAQQASNLHDELKAKFNTFKDALTPNIHLAQHDRDALHTHLSILHTSIADMHDKVDTAKKEADEAEKKTEKKAAHAARCNNAVTVVKTITANMDAIRSGDPRKVTTGVVNIVGDLVGLFDQPWCPELAAACQCFTLIFSFFGPKEPSTADLVKKAIDNAFAEKEENDIKKDLKESIANLGTEITFMTVGQNEFTEKEMPRINAYGVLHLTQHILAELSQHITNILSEKNIDGAKVAHYAKSYVQISVMTSMAVMLQCSILKKHRNFHASAKAGAAVIKERFKKDRDLMDTLIRHHIDWKYMDVLDKNSIYDYAKNCGIDVQSYGIADGFYAIQSVQSMRFLDLKNRATNGTDNKLALSDRFPVAPRLWWIARSATGSGYELKAQLGSEPAGTLHLKTNLRGGPRACELVGVSLPPTKECKWWIEPRPFSSHCLFNTGTKLYLNAHGDGDRTTYISMDNLDSHSKWKLIRHDRL